MLQAIAIGILVAGFVHFPKIVRNILPDFPWDTSVLILGVGVLALLVGKAFLDTRDRNEAASSLTRLLIYVHSPGSRGSIFRWVYQGLLSFFLCLISGVVGPEGAAVEFAQALQMKWNPPSIRWFEQKRRTHVASVLAAAISAAFGAPFTGVLLTMELGIGGRNLVTVMSALVALMMSRWLQFQFAFKYIEPIELQRIFTQFPLNDWHEWMRVVFVALLGGLVGGVLLLFTRFTQISLIEFFKTKPQFKVLAGIVLLFAVYQVSQDHFQISTRLLLPDGLLTNLLNLKYSASQAAFLCFSQFLVFVVLVSGVGTAGWIWPLVSLGALFGAGLFHGASSAVLAGIVAFWSAVLNAPIAGAVLALELTQNIQFLLPALLVGFLSVEVRRLLKVKPLLAQDLEAHGQVLLFGRSKAVLDTIWVRDAMVTDCFVAESYAHVADLRKSILKSSYPFIPVTNRDGVYQGLLTADVFMVKASDPRVDSLLEVKDLVYRNAMEAPTVLESDPLASGMKWFSEFPCIPVLGSDQKLKGLLFDSFARLAYDREVARRSFEFMPKEKNE